MFGAFRSSTKGACAIGKPHPTAETGALDAYLLEPYTLEGEIVLDHFMGSGSTAVACQKMKRHFIGIEKSFEYAAIDTSRLRDPTTEELSRPTTNPHRPTKRASPQKNDGSGGGTDAPAVPKHAPRREETLGACSAPLVSQFFFVLWIIETEVLRPRHHGVAITTPLVLRPDHFV